MTFGRTGDVPVPGDYDVHGADDVAVYRPSRGQWLVRGAATVTLGRPGDLPVPSNYHSTDVHGLRTLPAVFRPTDGSWLRTDAGTTTTVRFGRSGDVPV